MNGRVLNETKIEAKIKELLATLPAYVADWDLYMKASRKTAATRLDYINKVKRFLSSIKEDPVMVAPVDINERNVTEYFISTQTKTENGETKTTSDSYQQTIWCCLSSFLDFMVAHRLTASNYMRAISKPKNHDLERINEHRVRLEAKDFKAIMKAVRNEPNETIRSRDTAILMLFMNTGMRKTALQSIMLEDINLQDHTLTVIDKGNKRHQYVLNEHVTEALRGWIAERPKYSVRGNDSHLFLSNRGTAMGAKTISDVVEKYAGVSPHKLRSGFCSILYKKTGDIEFVRRAVGHANSATTARYIVTNGEEKQKAAEIMGSII